MLPGQLDAHRGRGCECVGVTGQQSADGVFLEGDGGGGDTTFGVGADQACEDVVVDLLVDDHHGQDLPGQDQQCPPGEVEEIRLASCMCGSVHPEVVAQGHEGGAVEDLVRGDELADVLDRQPVDAVGLLDVGRTVPGESRGVRSPPVPQARDARTSYSR